MNKLEKLIAKLCPNGVEYKPLGEIGIRHHGTTITAGKMAQLASEEGDVRVFAAGSTVANIPAKNIPSKDIIHEPGIVVKSRGYIGFEFCTCPFTHKNELWSYTANGADVDLKFVYYYLQTQVESLQKLARSKSVKLPQLATGDTDKLEIPLPPLAVQEEIVRMLDGMAGLISELEQELAARKQQYEWYRDKLLKMTNGVGYKKLTIGEIAQISRGKVMSKIYLREHAGVYPVYSSQTANNGEFGRIDSFDFDGEYLTWTTDGANAGSVFYRNGKFSITNVCGLIKVTDEDVDTQYLGYALRETTKDYVSPGMGNAKLMSNVMAAIVVKIPPLTEQKKIVARLESFDKLCNSMTEGLPGEIALRKQQYEFYRDQLLNFRRAEHGSRERERVAG